MSIRSLHSAKEFTAALEAAGSALVIVDWYTTWCGPCRRIAPELEALSKAESKCVFLKVDAEECDELAEEFQIEAFPTFTLLKKGKECRRITGANLEKLKSKISKYQ
jgi:thioredoxin 1